jgi:GTP pyrophosphokinase
MSLDDDALVARARSLATRQLAARSFDDGEPMLAHAEGVAELLASVGAPAALIAAAWLVPVARLASGAHGPHAPKVSHVPNVAHVPHVAHAPHAPHAPHEEPGPVVAIEQDYGATVASMVDGALRLSAVAHTAREAHGAAPVEGVRRMMLAFSRDLRGVVLHLATRLQSLRWRVRQDDAGETASFDRDAVRDEAQEALTLLAPLAARLGVWRLKWELEDLGLRLTQPRAYATILRQLDAERDTRWREIRLLCEAVQAELETVGVRAEVTGRAKHLYSIWRKMQGKGLDFDQVLDLQALRVIVDDVDACYAALARLQSRWRGVEGEFDDYIARPKPNGYRSLHCVVLDDAGRPVEIQIRTREMHEHAEHGVAAHWAYKEAGARGHAGVATTAGTVGAHARDVTQARKALLQQMLDWGHDDAQPGAGADTGSGADAVANPETDRVYVFTPQGAVVDLPAQSTPIDFAYAVHTALGHRCRGAKLDGALVPLNTPVRQGQTVEVLAAKEGGPSMDWLNPELGYIASPRSRAKARAWFNALAHEQTVAVGRERLERQLQRTGHTAAKHAQIASKLAFDDAEQLYLALGKDELALRDIDALWQAQPVAFDDAQLLQRQVERAAQRQAQRERDGGGRGEVLVVGVDSLMTGLARCCRPAPPDAIGGFVTRHKGVAIHRAACTNYGHMASRSPQRVVPVAWGDTVARDEARFAVDVVVEARDREGLLRDISEVFAMQRINVAGVQTHTAPGGRGERGAWMTFTVEVSNASALTPALRQVARVQGVVQARRR